MPTQPYTEISQVAFECQWGDTTEDVYVSSKLLNPVPLYLNNAATGNGRLYGSILHGRIKNSDLNIAENKRTIQSAIGWVALPQTKLVYSVKSCWYSLVKGNPSVREFYFLLETPHPYYEVE